MVRVIATCIGFLKISWCSIKTYEVADAPVVSNTHVPLYKRVPRQFVATSWYPPDVKPVYFGSYQVKTNNGIKYRLWTGKHWTAEADDCDAAKWNWIWNPKKDKTLYPWRGITEESR